MPWIVTYTILWTARSFTSYTECRASSTKDPELVKDLTDAYKIFKVLRLKLPFGKYVSSINISFPYLRFARLERILTQLKWSLVTTKSGLHCLACISFLAYPNLWCPVFFLFIFFVLVGSGSGH